MEITNIQYRLNDNDENCQVRATIDGQVMFIPLDPANRHYAEILKQVASGDLTIAEAD
tara:strand:+ start:3498 stop:3671 length:174 start_codon:yes stop_codon:yes gene_type:complete